jgi:hypothetical protein
MARATGDLRTALTVTVALRDVLGQVLVVLCDVAPHPAHVGVGRSLDVLAGFAGLLVVVIG